MFNKKPRKKDLSQQCKTCQNSGYDCWFLDDNSKCARYLPIDNTNLTEIDGVIETPPGIDDDMVCQMFTNWIDSLGWHFTGITGPYKDEE